MAEKNHFSLTGIGGRDEWGWIIARCGLNPEKCGKLSDVVYCGSNKISLARGLRCPNVIPTDKQPTSPADN